jgi:AbiTii
MTKLIPMVRQLQAEAIDADIPVAKLLRLPKVIATKLEQKDALLWIDRELNGYMDLKSSDQLPAYRMLQGQPKAYNPYHGWQTIHFPSDEHARVFTKAPMGESIGSLEQSLQSRPVGKRGQIMFPYSQERKEVLRKAIRATTDTGIFLTEGQVWGIVEAVRNLVLNWSLELEKAGVLGEEMLFTEQEKEDAGTVTQQFIIQNVGVLGNVSGSATVSNQQSTGLDATAMQDFVTQALAVTSQLPTGMQQEFRQLISQLQSELRKEKPDPIHLREYLSSARTVVEGALGNIAASGVVTMIGRLLGA